MKKILIVIMMFVFTYCNAEEIKTLKDLDIFLKKSGVNNVEFGTYIDIDADIDDGLNIPVGFVEIKDIKPEIGQTWKEIRDESGFILYQSEPEAIIIDIRTVNTDTYILYKQDECNVVLVSTIKDFIKNFKYVKDK